MASTRSASSSATRRIEALVTYVLLFGGAFIICIPFFWMISTSLKEQMAVYLFPPQWIPDPIRWDNYLEAFRRAEFPARQPKF